MKETLKNKYGKPKRHLCLLAYLYISTQTQVNRSQIRFNFCITQCEGHHKTLHSVVEFSLLILHKKVFSHFYCFSWKITFPVIFFSLHWLLLLFSSLTQSISKNGWFSSITMGYAVHWLNMSSQSFHILFSCFRSTPITVTPWAAQKIWNDLTIAPLVGGNLTTSLSTWTSDSLFKKQAK